MAEGEWYRLVTSGFLHASLIHIGFNMLLLFFLGRLLEPAIGTPRFVALYFASLLGGSFGALLLEPDALTLGASGAIFGVFGADLRDRPRPRHRRARLVDRLPHPVQPRLQLRRRRDISLGGHLGGLVARRALRAASIVAGERGMLGAQPPAAEMAAMAALGVALDRRRDRVA